LWIKIKAGFAIFSNHNVLLQGVASGTGPGAMILPKCICIELGASRRACGHATGFSSREFRIEGARRAPSILNLNKI